MDQAATTTLRITRRGRVVLSALLALPIFAATLFLATPGAQAGASAGEVTTYTVLAGESLWDIAGEIAPDEDPRAVIDKIRHTNSLSGAEVFPGQTLVLPAGY
jgi:nucleoid-associated protein YgaU